MSQFLSESKPDLNPTDVSTPVYRRTRPDIGDELEHSDIIVQHLRKVLDLAGDIPISRETDFFDLGLDSRGVSELLTKVHSIPGGKYTGVTWKDIYQYPTATLLALKIYKTGEVKPTTESDRMAALIKKYSVFTPHVPGEAKDEDDYYIAVTGATGTVGAHIVAKLIANLKVKKVYCLVRKSLKASRANTYSPEAIKSPVILALRRQGLQVNDNESKITAYHSQLALKNLGLNEDDLKELKANMNVVIHVAWAVNYQMRLRSFQTLVKGTHNLIKLCLESERSTPASFNFISSIAVNPGLNPLLEAFLDSPGEYALGYAQSKYVAEQLCKKASEMKDMTARVLRLGQIVGDSTHGHWNANETVPVIVRFAIAVGVMPKPVNDEQVSWLPVDVAAEVCVNLALRPKDDGIVFNISNPNLYSWNTKFLPALQKQMEKPFVELVPTRWLPEFKKWDHGLSEFIESQYENDNVGPPITVVTDKAKALCAALAGTEITEPMVKLFVDFWGKVEGSGVIMARNGEFLKRYPQVSAKKEK